MEESLQNLEYSEELKGKTNLNLSFKDKLMEKEFASFFYS